MQRPLLRGMCFSFKCDEVFVSLHKYVKPSKSGDRANNYWLNNPVAS